MAFFKSLDLNLDLDPLHSINLNLSVISLLHFCLQQMGLLTFKAKTREI